MTCETVKFVNNVRVAHALCLKMAMRASDGLSKNPQKTTNREDVFVQKSRR